MYVEGDVPYVGNGNCNNNNDMFGSGWGGLIGLIAVAALFGWGNGGFGFGGGNGGAYSVDAAVQRGFDTNGIMNKLEGINNGLCDGFYAMNTGMLNGFGQVQQTLCAGFNGITNAVTTSGYETRNAINGVSQQLASCCCELTRNQERLACDIERSSNSIIQAGNANTQRIIDFLCNEKISALQHENAALTAQLSQNAQTQTILNAVNRTPSPAYVVPNPYTSYGYGAYGNSGCGCGCGCGCN